MSSMPEGAAGARTRARPLVLGHRGYRAQCPENTLRAFARAIECGADGIECDVQKSSDGRFVLVHDAAVDRVSNGAGEVRALSFNELRRLDFGEGERIPELSEMLDTLPPGAWLDLELKAETLSVADCAPIAKILAARADMGRLMVSSFEPGLLAPFRRARFPVGFLVGRELLSAGALRIAAVLLRLRPRFLNLPVELVQSIGPRRARLVLRVLHLLGFSILFWTVNSAAEVAPIADLVDIIVTDEVEKILHSL